MWMFQGRRGNQDPDPDPNPNPDSDEGFEDAQEVEPEPELEPEPEIEPRIVSGENYLPDQVLMGNIIPNIPDRDYNMNIPQSNIIMAEPLETQRDTRGRIMIEYSTVRKRLLKLDRDLKKCLEENARLKTDLFSVQRTKGWVIFKGCNSFHGHNVEDWPAHRVTRDEGDKNLKGIALRRGYCGFGLSNGSQAWMRHYSIGECLSNIVKADSIDFYLAPGAEIHSLVTKSNQGFTIIFENENDRKLFLERGGILRASMNPKKTKKKNKPKNTKKKNKKKRKATKKKKK